MPMIFSKRGHIEKKGENKPRKFSGYVRNRSFQKTFIIVSTLIITYLIVLNGAIPVKYKLEVGDRAPRDIFAPRDIENTMLTEENARQAAEQVPVATRDITAAPVEVLNATENFFTAIEETRRGIEKKLADRGISGTGSNYENALRQEQYAAAQSLYNQITGAGITLTEEQVYYLVARVSDDELAGFKKLARKLISEAMKQDITETTLNVSVSEVQAQFQESALPQDLKNIGSVLAKAIMKPNKVIDEEQTKRDREKAYEDAINNSKVIIEQNSKIVSKGEIITEDKYKVLSDLKMIETRSIIDIPFALSVLLVILLLALFLAAYIRFFARHVLKGRNEILLLCLIIILTVFIARVCYEYSTLTIPIFIAPMLISILLDLGLAGVVSTVLAIAVSFITKGDITFFYMSIISGYLSAFLVSRAKHRSRLSLAGALVGLINVLIVASIGIIYNKPLTVIARNSLTVFLNGIICMILTIGMLPIWESTFNIITPLKLLELTDPNHPLLKKMLMEAPGTYHHSLMVGNLAEVACEDIGGNSLLARVGAYFHDVGKLKRPNFFRENQFGDNPHDKMTPNLSTLVITSHAQDGVELAAKYKIPQPVRDIIQQHHGTTMVAYFYHKAKNSEKGDTVKAEDFRYEGPKPKTKEAAVVMLADSVEAAVRAMPDKTEGKMEGLIRKIIKEKLDDGQLDQCELTLKDLDRIARAFMRVLSGLFHERQEYPDVTQLVEKDKDDDAAGVATNIT